MGSSVTGGFTQTIRSTSGPHGRHHQRCVHHADGIRHLVAYRGPVSAKGDGRYIISNGKDQALRLWDLRKMRTSAEFEALDGLDYGISNFDYR